jgi:hypothetical protein
MGKTGLKKSTIATFAEIEMMDRKLNPKVVTGVLF